MGDEVLFCPFCRESFEGHTECPHHELALVPWQRLPRSREQDAPPSRVSLWDLRMGRGFVMLAALSLWVAFFCPFVSWTGAMAADSDMWRLAVERAPTLWFVPLSALALVSIVARRRTVDAMRAARVVLPLLALVPSLVVGMTLWDIHQAAGIFSQRHALPLTPHVRVGAHLVVVASALGVWGGARLGQRIRLGSYL